MIKLWAKIRDSYNRLICELAYGQSTQPSEEELMERRNSDVYACLGPDKVAKIMRAKQTIESARKHTDFDAYNYSTDVDMNNLPPWPVIGEGNFRRAK
jgi:hypothetical protein